MRIALVSNLYPSDGNPSRAVFVRNVEIGLESMGAVISHKSVIKGQSFIITTKAYRYVKFFLRTLWVGLFADKIDLIYAHYSTHCAPPLLISGLFRKRRLAVNVHGGDVIPHSIFERALQPFANLLLRRANLIVVPSGYFCDKLRSRMPDIGDHLYVSPSGGIDGSVFHHTGGAHDIRAKHGIPGEDFVLGFVSRIEKEKGWKLFIALVEALRGDGSRVTGVIVGDGSEVDLMAREIRERALTDSVRYLGLRTQTELSEIYNALDVFVFPTVHDSESLGLVGLEAMACGTPVIASDIGGPRSYVSHGKNGYLFPPGDVVSLIACAREIQHDRAKHDHLRANALITASHFESKRVIADLYRALAIVSGQEVHSSDSVSTQENRRHPSP